MSDELADLRARCERLQLLQQVNEVIHSTLDPQEALQLILREAVRVTHAASGSIVLLNPTTGFLEIHATHGLPPSATGLKLRVSEGITGWVARTGQPARVGDVTNDPRYIQLNRNTLSELAVPLIVAGETRGVINVDSKQRDAFCDDDQDLLTALAAQAARVIHNTWLYEQNRLKARLFESLTSVSQTLNSANNLDEVLQVVTREAVLLMNARMSSVLLLDETREWLDLRASHGAGPAYLGKARVSVDESFVGIVVRRQKPLQEENVQAAGRYQNTSVARAEGLVSLLSVPLVHSGQTLGVLNVYTAETHSFSNEEIRILTALAELSAIAIQKARLFEHIATVKEQLRETERLSALGLLAAEVAHEIRNPLTVMKMLYHSLDLRFPPDDPRAQDAHIIGDKMDHLNKIVEQILAFARSAEPHFAPVDVNRLVDELALLLRLTLAQNRIKLVRRLDTGLPALMADATQLEQVFLNLALNAIEAMPTGGTLTLTTAATSSGEISVAFHDTGAGMTEEEQRRAFTSVLSSSKPKGTGIGLALVRRVVEAHRGRIEIKSRKGRGTAIHLLLPP